MIGLLIIFPTLIIFVPYLLGQIAIFNLNENVASVITSIFSFLSYLDFVIPMDIVKDVLLATIAFKGSIFLLRGVNWMLEHFVPKPK